MSSSDRLTMFYELCEHAAAAHNTENIRQVCQGRRLWVTYTHRSRHSATFDNTFGFCMNGKPTAATKKNIEKKLEF